jgi:hypothetical protein
VIDDEPTELGCPLSFDGVGRLEPHNGWPFGGPVSRHLRTTSTFTLTASPFDQLVNLFGNAKPGKPIQFDIIRHEVHAGVEHH